MRNVNQIPTLDEISEMIEEMSRIKERKEVVRKCAEKIGISVSPEYIAKDDVVAAAKRVPLDSEVREWLEHMGVREGVFITIRAPPTYDDGERASDVSTLARTIAEKLNAKVIGRIVDEWNYITDRIELYRDSDVGVYLDITYSKAEEEDP